MSGMRARSAAAAALFLLLSAAPRAEGISPVDLPGRAGATLHVRVSLPSVPSPSERERLAGLGLRLLRPLGDGVWDAALPADGRATARFGEGVGMRRWRAEEKLAPSILADRWHFWSKDGELVRVVVGLHDDVPVEELPRLACDHALGSGATVSGLRAALFELPAAQLSRLAAEDAVAWIAEAPAPLSPANDGTRRRMGIDETTGVTGLTGRGVRVLVYDQGVPRPTHGAFLDADGTSRLQSLDPTASSEFPHATAVAGTLAGDGDGGRGRGVAPGAEILASSLAFEPGTGVSFLDLLPDLESDLSLAVAEGADLASASLTSNLFHVNDSCDLFGRYGVAAALLDAIVRGDDPAVPARTLVFAAGNERGVTMAASLAHGPRELCRPNFGSISPPACSKNAILVGAIDDDGGAMSTFSSWGPCEDGRIGPTVVAPACETGLLTGEVPPYTATSGADDAYAPYMSGCGTSFAAPAVAGLLALLVEDWRRLGLGGDRPATDLVRALLIHSAIDRGHPGPDYAFGFGEVRAPELIGLLRRAAAGDGATFAGDEIETGGVREFPFLVSRGSPALRASLVWNDPAALPTSDGGIVDDLDLELVSPEGRIEFPFVLDPAEPDRPATRGRNSIDNAEQVVVANPAPGEWRIRVTGTSVPVAPQPFAVVASTPRTPPTPARPGAETLFESAFDGEAAEWTLEGPATLTPDSSGAGKGTTLLFTPRKDIPARAITPLRLPAGATSIELSFSWLLTRVASNENAVLANFFLVVVENEVGQPLGVVDLRSDAWVPGRWLAADRIDLTPFAGRSIRLVLEARERPPRLGVFQVDDVRVTMVRDPSAAAIPEVVPAD